jgi:hypothetical protein
MLTLSRNADASTTEHCSYVDFRLRSSTKENSSDDRALPFQVTRQLTYRPPPAYVRTRREIPWSRRSIMPIRRPSIESDTDAEEVRADPIAVSLIPVDFVPSESLRGLNPRRLSRFFPGVLGDPDVVADLDTVDVEPAAADVETNEDAVATFDSESVVEPEVVVEPKPAVKPLRRSPRLALKPRVELTTPSSSKDLLKKQCDCFLWMEPW